MQGATDGLPGWAQAVIVVAGALAVFVGTLYGYIKKGRQASAGGEVALVSATFTGRDEARELVAALERVDHNLNGVCDELRKHRLAIEENTDATINLLRFIKRGEP